MTLLRLRTRAEIPPYMEIPEEWIHDALIREMRPDYGSKEIIGYWDERRGNETGRDLRKRWNKRCPKCSHRSWMKPYFDRDAYHCRWGHVVTGYEMHR